MLGDYDKGHRNTSKILNDNMSDSAFYQFLFNFYQNIGAKTKPGGTWYVFHADSEGSNFRNAFIKSGLELKQCLIWVKNSLVMGRQDYQWKHEPCLYGWKPGAAHYFINDRTQTTVIDDKINLKKLSKGEMYNLLKEIFSEKVPTSVIYHDKPIRNDLHPTMKPIGLMGYLIKNSSKRLNIVADPFLGSGSTMVACHQLNRRCFGMELDPSYCEVILDRIRKLDPEIIVKKNGIEMTRKANPELQLK
jgi:DNA modification methylase